MGAQSDGKKIVTFDWETMVYQVQPARFIQDRSYCTCALLKNKKGQKLVAVSGNWCQAFLIFFGHRNLPPSMLPRPTKFVEIRPNSTILDHMIGLKTSIYNVGDYFLARRCHFWMKKVVMWLKKSFLTLSGTKFEIFDRHKAKFDHQLSLT